MFRKLFALLFLALLLNTAYISAFATPSVFYMGNVLLHVLVGIGLFVAFARLMAKDPDLRSRATPALIALLAAALTGGYLTAFGATRAHNWALYTHIVTAVIGVLLLFPYVLGRPAPQEADGSASVTPSRRSPCSCSSSRCRQGCTKRNSPRPTTASTTR